MRKHKLCYLVVFEVGEDVFDLFCSPCHERLYSLWLVFLKSGFDSGEEKRKL